DLSGSVGLRRSGSADASEQRCRGSVADRAMGSYLVIVSTPTLKLFPGVRQRQEPMRVQALRAQSAVERLDEGIVRRLAGSREVEHDLVLIGPQIQVARHELA